MAKATFYNYNSTSPTQVTREEYTNVGSGDNFVGNYPRAIKGGTDFEIWDSAVGGTQLVEDTDYQLINQDKVLTPKAGFDVYAGYKILNATYQTGSIYITYKILQSYNDADIQNDIRTELDTLTDVGTNVLSKNGNYTILDSDLTSVGELFIYCDGTSSSVTITLPTLADNQNKKVTLYVLDDTNLTTLDGEGSETIENLLTVELPKNYNTITVLAQANEWKIVNECITCQLRLYNYSGYGSTDTKIMRFTTSLENIGNLFSENHSTGYNSNTEGLEITINKAGKYAFTYQASQASLEAGFSLNSSQLTTDIQSISTADQLTFSSGLSSGFMTKHWSGWLVANDIVRAHADGVAPYLSLVNFTATYLGS